MIDLVNVSAHPDERGGLLIEDNETIVTLSRSDVPVVTQPEFEGKVPTPSEIVWTKNERILRYAA